jgi:hypothetical protein
MYTKIEMVGQISSYMSLGCVEGYSFGLRIVFKSRIVFFESNRDMFVWKTRLRDVLKTIFSRFYNESVSPNTIGVLGMHSLKSLRVM